MNDVINEMNAKKEHPGSESIILHFIQNRRYKNTIIIVEGVSDKDFYKKTNNELLNNAFYIFANKASDIVGKKAVIDAYFRIRDLYSSQPYNNSLIFIVDKDFFGINWEAPAYKDLIKNRNATHEDINNFTVLDCHSHECYFILEKNLKQIFKLLNIEDKLEQFNNILEENIEDFARYFAYKSILEDENPESSNYLRDWKNIKGIDFDFEFKNDKLVFNKYDMQNAIDRMKYKIECSRNKFNLEKQYLEMKQKLKAQPELLRGHTLFELLECYLNYYGKTIKNYKEYNDKIIKEMDIPLNIKVLKFDNGRYELEK